MRFNCKKKERNVKEWHFIFAWKVIKVSDTDCRWLEFVERREIFVGTEITPGSGIKFGIYTWEYR